MDTTRVRHKRLSKASCATHCFETFSWKSFSYIAPVAKQFVTRSLTLAKLPTTMR